MIEIRFALRAIYPELLNIHRQYSAGGAISDAFNIQVLAGPLLRLFFLCVCVDYSCFALVLACLVHCLFSYVHHIMAAQGVPKHKIGGKNGRVWVHAGSGLLLTLSDSVWLLQASEFSAFVDHAGLVGEGFQLSEVDTVFIACNVDMSKKKLNPERSLSRYEFMEAIVRIAHAKYNKSELAAGALLDVRKGVCTRRRSQLAC